MTATEITPFGDPTKGILYKEDGSPRVPLDAINFFVLLGSFLDLYDALSAADKTKVDTLLFVFGIDLTDGLSAAEITTFGDSTKGILYKEDGSPRVPLDAINFFVLLGSFLDLYDALSAADKTKVDTLLLVFGIDLTDGLSAAEITTFGDSTKGILYKEDGSPRVPLDAINFFVLLGSFLDLYDALSVAEKTKVDTLLLVFGIDLTDGLSAAEITTFGDSTKGILYKEDGSPRVPLDAINFFVLLGSFLDLYDALSVPEKTKVDTLLLVFGIDLTDGLSAAEITTFGDSTKGILYKEDGSPRVPLDATNFFVLLGSFLDLYDALSAAEKTKVDTLLLVFGIDLSTPMTAAEITTFGDPTKGILYKEDGSPRVPLDAINFFSLLGSFLDSVDALPAAEKTKVDNLFL